MAKTTKILRTDVHVGGKLYPAGTEHTAELAKLIPFEKAWVEAEQKLVATEPEPDGDDA